MNKNTLLEQISKDKKLFEMGEEVEVEEAYTGSTVVAHEKTNITVTVTYPAEVIAKLYHRDDKGDSLRVNVEFDHKFVEKQVTTQIAKHLYKLLKGKVSDEHLANALKDSGSKTLVGFAGAFDEY